MHLSGSAKNITLSVRQRTRTLFNHHRAQINMNKKLLSISGLLLLLFSACNTVDTGVLLNHFQTPQEDHPALTRLFSDQYAIIPLETTDDCLLGAITKIKKHKGHYYISTTDGKSLYRFNEQGQFINALHKQGQGPGEYIRIEDFDVYEIDGKQEIWISDNKNLKIYDADNGSFKHQISFPFFIYKFRRLESSHILLVTNKDKTLALTDEQGNILKEELKKEIPYIMFRPVQFVRHNNQYLFQLGISNSFIAFDRSDETFKEGMYTNEASFLSKEQLLELFNTQGMEYIAAAYKQSFIDNVITTGKATWLITNHKGALFLTRCDKDGQVSTRMQYGSLFSTLIVGDSEESILLYADFEQLEESGLNLQDKNGKTIEREIDDNPCLIEFF